MSGSPRTYAHAALVIGGLLLAGVMTLRWIPLGDPFAIALDARFQAPLSAGAPLGTDELGRDVLARAARGASMTLMVSIAATVAALMIGTVVGGVAGYWAGTCIDDAFNWVANLLLSMPFLLVMASVLSVWGPSLWKAYAMLAALMWVQPARLVRGEVRRLRVAGYIMAARSLGASEARMLVLLILPRAMRPAIVVAYSQLPDVVALEAGLSFLGLGVQPPEPGLGRMIFDGLPYLHSAWWLALTPAGLLLGIGVSLVLTQVRSGGPNDR